MLLPHCSPGGKEQSPPARREKKEQRGQERCWSGGRAGVPWHLLCVRHQMGLPYAELGSSGLVSQGSRGT